MVHFKNYFIFHMVSFNFAVNHLTSFPAKNR